MITPLHLSPYSHDDHRCSKSLAGGVPILEPVSLLAVREECMLKTHYGRFLSLHSQFLSWLPLMRGEWGKIMSEGQLSTPRKNLIRTESILSKRNPPVMTDNQQLYDSKRDKMAFLTELYTVSNVKIKSLLNKRCTILEMCNHTDLFFFDVNLK